MSRSRRYIVHVAYTHDTLFERIEADEVHTVSAVSLDALRVKMRTLAPKALVLDIYHYTKDCRFIGAFPGVVAELNSDAIMNCSWDELAAESLRLQA